MTGTAASFTYLIAMARDLLARVTGRDGLAARPFQLRPTATHRLAAGIRVLASFVRRLLVLMALSMEHGLVDGVDRDTPLPRTRPRAGTRRLQFKVLAAPFSGAIIVHEAPETWIERIEQALPARRAQPPSPALLLRKLDLLAAILADPEPRARRLAFHLARRRPGTLLPPAGPARIAGVWGSDVRASHEAMAGAILLAGRKRPPPLPPPRRAGPEATWL